FKKKQEPPQGQGHWIGRKAGGPQRPAMDADAEAGLFMTAGGSNGRTAGATSGSANARSVAGAASGAPGIALRTVATEADLLSLQPRWDALARRQERQFVE